MKFSFTVALVLTAALAVAPLFAQASGDGQSAAPGQSKPASAAPESAAPKSAAPASAASESPAADSQTNANPFPGSNATIPVLPSGPTANVPEGSYARASAEAAAASLPPDDQDPVRSPDNTAPDSGEVQGFSSSLTGLDDLLPPADNSQPGKGNNQQIAPLPQESPANDVKVGNYYLSNKNWRAALSRFQSALVLDPENPDVYWGLAESEQHLGDYASARAHYLKVLEYDPGSRHAKDADKALLEPEIANAKPSSTGKAANANTR
ncbi:MAG: tetratricopeptide repeat protein [Terracidiphilus sp.]